MCLLQDSFLTFTENILRYDLVSFFFLSFFLSRPVLSGKSVCLYILFLPLLGTSRCVTYLFRQSTTPRTLRYRRWTWPTLSSVVAAVGRSRSGRKYPTKKGARSPRRTAPWPSATNKSRHTWPERKARVPERVATNKGRTTRWCGPSCTPFCPLSREIFIRTKRMSTKTAIVIVFKTAMQVKWLEWIEDG